MDLKQFPCKKFQTNECEYGDDCCYSHTITKHEITHTQEPMEQDTAEGDKTHVDSWDALSMISKNLTEEKPGATVKLCTGCIAMETTDAGYIYIQNFNIPSFSLIFLVEFVKIPQLQFWNGIKTGQESSFWWCCEWKISTVSCS